MSSLPDKTHPLSTLELKQIRLIDANINRACEGIRVIEDIYRFILDNKERSEQLKKMRHELRQAFDQEILISHRDSLGDVGRGVLKYGSQTRSEIKDIIKANCKRIQESMRVVEEFAKLEAFEHSDSQKLGWEDIRYQLYSMEKELLQSEQEDKS